MREAGGRHCVLVGGFLLVALGLGALISSYVAASNMGKLEDQVCSQIQNFTYRVIPPVTVSSCPKCATPMISMNKNDVPCGQLSNPVARRRCQMQCAETNNCLNPTMITPQTCKDKIRTDSVPYVLNMIYRIDRPSYSISEMQADVSAGAYSSGALVFILISLATGIPGILAPIYETAAMPFSARFCNIWYSISAGIMVIPTTIVAVLYFILFVVFTQSNSISGWLSEDSVDAGKCNTFFAARELLTYEEAMGTGLLPSYPSGGLNGGGQSIYSCAYFTAISKEGAVPVLCTAIILSLASIVLFFASCACCYYKPVQAKTAYDTDHYPEPALSFNQPSAVYTTAMDQKAVLPRHEGGKDAWKDPWNPLPVPGANEGHYWHTRSLVPEKKDAARKDEAYVGSWCDVGTA